MTREQRGWSQNVLMRDGTCGTPRRRAVAGWLTAALLAAAVFELRRRLELVARADHELRGPATVVALAAERLGRDPATAPAGEALRGELDRMRVALDDLAHARRGTRRPLRLEPVELASLARSAAAAWAPALAAAGRPVRIDWPAGGVRALADRGRLAQALGNLMANAAEHGSGPVEITASRTRHELRVEVRNQAGDAEPPTGDRGRGLSIAASAAEDVGGRLEFDARGGRAVAALELPADAG